MAGGQAAAILLGRESGWGQVQIGTVWAIEAPLSGGLWRARRGSPSGVAGNADWNQIGPRGPGPGAGRGGGKRLHRLAGLRHRFGLPGHPTAPSHPTGSRALRCPGHGAPMLAPSLGGGCCWGWPCPRVPAAAPGTSMFHGEDAWRDVSCPAARPRWEHMSPRLTWHDLWSHEGLGSLPWWQPLPEGCAFQGAGTGSGVPSVAAPVRMGLSPFHPVGSVQAAGGRR